MVFVDTLKLTNGETEKFSKEKVAIMLFENMCNLGEPNLNLSEKLAFLICDRVNAKFSKEITFEKYDEIIKEILHQENQISLLEAYIFKKNKPETPQIDEELKNIIFKMLLNLDEVVSPVTKLINIHSTLNSLQNNQFEKLNKKIFEYIRAGNFYPSSTFLREINHNQQFSSSYSFKVQDTIESIFETLSISSIVQKYGSSVGVDFSPLRSKKDKVKSINRNACGPIKVIDLFSSAKSMIGYNKNNSDNLYYISIEHPDILSFLNLSNVSENLAITIPDRFMTSFLEGSDYFTEKKIKVSPVSLIDLISSKIITGQKINLIFIDLVYKKNPLIDNLSFSISPVGLQPVFEGTTFTTGVIDVSKLVNVLGNSKTFDWMKLKTIIRDAMEFLDNVIDLTQTIDDTYTQKLKETRQIYLSITGFYSLLSKLDIPYGSDDSINFADALSNYINYYSKQKSTELSKERGPFLKFIKSKYEQSNFSFEKTPVQKTLFSGDLSVSKKYLKNMPSIDWIELRNNIKKYGLRNSTTFSIIFSDFYSLSNETSNGIDPITHYKSTFWINGQKFEKINKEVLQLVSDLKPTWNNQEIENALPENVKSKMPLAKNVSSHFYVRLQTAFEKNTDGSTNLKVYLTDDVTILEIKNLITETYKNGNLLFLPEKLNGKDFSLNKMSLWKYKNESMKI